MVDRTTIAQALDSLISNEEGMRFQSLAIALAKLRWPELIACERHNDLGVDAHASPDLSPDKIGKGLACSITAKFEKLNHDARAIKGHFDSISIVIFATPQKVTKTTEKKWADRLLAEYGCQLVVVSREDIISSLQIPENAWMCRTYLGIPVPYEPSIFDHDLQQTQEAAAQVVANWTKHSRLAGKPQIALNMVASGERDRETRNLLVTARLNTSMLQGQRIVLGGPAGSGKTTTLIQFAQVSSDSRCIPLLVDLPDWIKSGIDIFDHISHSPAFRERRIDAVTLAAIALKGSCIFLLNGWNEIPEFRLQDAANALLTLSRDFPTAGVIVTTRTLRFAPELPGSRRVSLLPLTLDQRLSYMEEALGTSQATVLNSRLSGNRVMSELTRLPFFLTEVITIFQSDHELPRTKIGLLGAAIALIEQLENHSIHLQQRPLMGQAENYLSSLAAGLTARADVILGEAEARAICSDVSERLKNAKQIDPAPHPADVLDTLCAHHVLETNYPRHDLRFQHQLFQEYYSALTLRDALNGAVASADYNDRLLFAEKYINEPAWEEPLRMIAEEIGAKDNNSASVDQLNDAKLLVQAALRVDPILAGGLARLCGSSLWKEVRSEVSKRLRSWYAVPDRHHQRCALAAMLATGSDEFADVLTPLLTNSDQQVRLATYRAGADFHPSSLGRDWQKIVAGWDEQPRIDFISELTLHQGTPELALTFALSDPSPMVRMEAMRDLAWVGQTREVAELLQALPDQEFQQALQELDTEDIPQPLRSHAISKYNSILSETVDRKSRFQIALRLAELGYAETPKQLKDELTALPSAIAKELSAHSLRPAVEIIRKVDPQWVSQWVANQIIAGALWPDAWLSMVTGIPKPLSEHLLQRVCTENLRRAGTGGIISLLASTADAALAKAIFGKLVEHRKELIADPGNGEKQEIDAQLKGLFKALAVPVAVEGLSDILARQPADSELSVIAEMFSDTVSERADLRSLLPDNLRQQLRQYFKRAVSGVLDDDLSAQVEGRLVSALGEVGEPEDAADLIELINVDIRRLRNNSILHIQTLVRLAKGQAESTLIALLWEPKYEIDAAWGLREIAKVQPSNNPIGEARFGWPIRDYRKVRSAPPGWSTNFDEGRRVRCVSAVTRRIVELQEESRGGDHKAVPYHRRLKELAKVLADMDPKHSAELIFEIATLPASHDGWLRVALLEGLVFGGATMPTDVVARVVDPVIEHFRAHGLYGDDANLLRRFLSILPFVDSPATAIARVRELLSEFGLAVHGHRDFLIALGQCGSDEGLSLLRDIAQHNSTVFQNSAKYWIEAVAACPLPGASLLLLSFVDPAVSDGIVGLSLPDYAADLLASRLSDLAHAHGAVAERILELCRQSVLPQQRLLLAKVMARLHTPQSLLTALYLLDDDSPQPIPYDLRRALEEVFLEKRQSGENPNAYTFVPRSGSDIKKRLLEMVEQDPRRAHSAYNLLGQIEEWRLEYGRPSSEPRHPAYESGKPWPPLPPIRGETGGGENGHVEVFSEPIGREKRLQQFLAAHPGATVADIKYSASVFSAEFQKWRKDRLKEASVMSRRIEDVLSGAAPLKKKPRKQPPD